MMKRSLFFLKILPVLLLSAFLMSCGKNSDSESVVYHIFRRDPVAFPEGVLSVDEDQLLISSYETGETLPLCSRPNCEHLIASSSNPEPQCYAVFENGVEYAYFFQNQLYVFSRPGPNETVVYRANVDGSGRKAFATFDYEPAGRATLVNGKVYFPAHKTVYSESLETTDEYDHFIACFDSSTGKMTEITPRANDYGGSFIIGVADGYLFFGTQHSEEPFDIDAYIADPDSVALTYHYYRYSLAKGTTEPFLQEEPILEMLVEGDENIYYKTKEGSQYVLWKYIRNGTREELRKTDSLASLSCQIIGGKVLYFDELSDFQLLYRFASESAGRAVIGSINGGQLAVMKVEDYLNSKEDYLLLKNYEVHR